MKNFIRLIWIFILLLLAFSTSCHASSDSLNQTEIDTVKILSFNILYGGDEIDFSKVFEAIQKSKAKIVAIQEAEGNIPRLAKALGWKYYDKRMHLLSQFPIISATLTGWYYVLVELSPGKVIAFSNVHLPSDPYGPDLIMAGTSRDSVLSNEYDLRYHELDYHMPLFDSIMHKKIPLIVTGDFNSPSFRDWNDSSLLVRPQMKYTVEWPVSKRMENAGFIDTYRNANPDVLANPGLTWTPGNPFPQPGEIETHDRIDFIWASGIEKVIHSTLVGEVNGSDVGISVFPYPTDHRGVLTTILVSPVAVGSYIQAFPKDESVLIRFFSDQELGLSVSILDEERHLIKLIEDIGSSEYQKTVFLKSPGNYSIKLQQKENLFASTEYIATSKDYQPVLSVQKRTFKTNEPIAVEWKYAPGNRFDWIAIYRDSMNTADDYYKLEQKTSYILNKYTYAKVSGQMVFNEYLNGIGWPLEPGRYRIHLLLDDGYTSLASIPIEVVN
jgi:endonuclease/exonuclease/phosphatase family metal-dependent hydrolase